MNFSISRETLLRPLQLIAGVAEKRQVEPILSNILIVVTKDILKLTATDLEVEMVAFIQLDTPPSKLGETTVSAKKLVDICKSLTDGSELKFKLDGQKLRIQSSRSRFSLSTLDTAAFPNIEEQPSVLSFSITQKDFKHILDRTAFSMATQDVRYFLNGVLLEACTNQLKAVATDGHRLALCHADVDIECDRHQIIVPRKGVLELTRLLSSDSDMDVSVDISDNHIRVNTGDLVFSSKLVDGKFPDYERVIPSQSNISIIGDRLELRSVFSRTAILSNEKYRGVRIAVSPNQMHVYANNPEQEQAEESLIVEADCDGLEMGFNVTYLLDVCGVLDTEQLRFTIKDGNSSALISGVGDESSLYVIMPMRL